MSEVGSQPEFILVPLDGSSNAERALGPACVLARALELPVRFVHVLPADLAADEDARTQAGARFATYVARLARKHRLAEDQRSLVVVDGSPDEAILREAQSARIVVLASHGRGGFKAAILGSVADRVVRGAERPTLLVRGTSAERVRSKLHRLLVCLDGSPEAERGLAFARDLAPRLGAELILLRSFSAPAQVTGEDFLYYNPEALIPELRNSANTYMRAIAWPDEEVVVAEGSAHAVIAQTSEELKADGIVLSTRGLGRAKRLFMGSVTDKVVRSAKVPVFVIPSAAD